jgi:Na+-translocating ferredoxin:NAD+ oxidoreductase subunit G
MNTPLAAPPPATTSLAMIRTLGLVATFCGLLIVTTYQGTLPAVTANKRVALERAVFKVIPGAVTMREFHASAAGVRPATSAPPAGAVRFYAAYDGEGALRGIAAEGAATGYADVVRVLYAYDPARQTITGLGVIGMRETPGIGDKIITDARFLENFVALDARLDADMKSLANAIRTVPHGAKRNAWEIDAIAGATVTCKAVGKGINDSAQRLLPLLLPNLESVKAGQAPDQSAHAIPFPLPPSPFPLS